MEQIYYLVFPFQNEMSIHRLIDVKVSIIENMEMTQRCPLPKNYEMDEGKLTKKGMQINRSGTHLSQHGFRAYKEYLCNFHLLSEVIINQGCSITLQFTMWLKSMMRGAAKPWGPDTEEEKNQRAGLKPVIKITCVIMWNKWDFTAHNCEHIPLNHCCVETESYISNKSLIIQNPRILYVYSGLHLQDSRAPSEPKNARTKKYLEFFAMHS